ncbi:stalk domain-containing protein [Brevibacillus sp. SYSU BS000544]|uniref:stalk domain-containing protein n=1 Tax=Brevibacillus sp. SYSU BS000544 TaxID=3416443 RepID=UPI003CE4A9AE
MDRFILYITLSLSIIIASISGNNVAAEEKKAVTELSGSMTAEVEYYPLPSLTKELGYELMWDEEKGIFQLKKDNVSITAEIGNNRIKVNDRFIVVNAPPQKIGKIPYVPLAFFRELFATDIKISVFENNSSVNQEVRRITLSTLTQNIISEIKKEPGFIVKAFELSKTELRTALGTEFKEIDDRQLFHVFSTLVSYELAPYGFSDATKLDKILKEPVLDCDNYALAALQLAKFDPFTSKNIPFNFVGWYGGAVGDHAQLITVDKTTGISLLLDPTIGLIAKASYNEILSGKPIKIKDIVISASRPEPKELGGFTKRVADALIEGKYKPTDIYYFFENVDQFFNVAGKMRTWPPDYVTPGASVYREVYQKMNNEQ